MSAAKRAEQEWQAKGGALWTVTFGAGLSDQQVIQKILDSAVASPLARDKARSANSAWHLTWCAKWVDGACRMLVSDERYLAAMACTKTGAHDTQDIHIPWPAFAVRIPSGLLPAGEGKWITHARCLQIQADEGPYSCLMIHLDGQDQPNVVIGEAVPLVDVLGDRSDFEDVAEPKDYGFDIAVATRSILMTKRCILGLLYTFQYTNNWKAPKGTTGGSPSSRAREAPHHRAIVVGRPISVDLAPAVRDVCRLGGPEDAPILARPYRVGPTHNEDPTPQSSHDTEK